MYFFRCKVTKITDVNDFAPKCYPISFPFIPYPEDSNPKMAIFYFLKMHKEDFALIFEKYKSHNMKNIYERIRLKNLQVSYQIQKEYIAHLEKEYKCQLLEEKM